LRTAKGSRGGCLTPERCPNARRTLDLKGGVSIAVRLLALEPATSDSTPASTASTTTALSAPGRTVEPSAGNINGPRSRTPGSR
jgi:hypothetical protein